MYRTLTVYTIIEQSWNDDIEPYGCEIRASANFICTLLLLARADDDHDDGFVPFPNSLWL